MPAAQKILAIIVGQGSPLELAPVHRAVAAQTVSVGSVILATALADELTTGPQDPLEAELPAQTVTYAGKFSDGIHAALAKHRPGDGQAQWLWLLHEDSIPQPGALAALVRAVESARAVGIAGAKQVHAHAPDQLISVGTSYTRFGARYTGVDPGDLDQGQLDGREDIYAVGTAGMLIRADLWDKIGGAEPVTSPLLDGLDISRKAHLAGQRVIVVPQAVIEHERRTLGADHSYRNRRQALLFHRWATTRLIFLPIVVLISILAGVLRGIWRIATKQFALAWADFLAPWWALGKPIALIKARARYRRIRQVPRSQLNELLTPVSKVRAMRKDLRQARAQSRKTKRTPSELELREQALLTFRRRTTLGVVLALIALMSLIALLPPLLQGPIVADGLRGVDSTWAQLWAGITSGWIAGGDGMAGPTHPISVALFALSTITGGPWGVPTWIGVAVFLGLAPILATWGAWVAAGAASRSHLLRALIALAWGASVPLWLLLGDAAFGEVLAYVLVPWWAYGLARTLGIDRRDVIASGLEADAEPVTSRLSGATSLAAMAGSALALAMIGAGIPAIGLLAAAVAFVVVLAARPYRSPGAVRRVWLMIVPLIVLLTPLVIDIVSSANPAMWWQLLITPSHVEWPLTYSAAAQSIPALSWQIWLLAAPLALGALVAIFTARTTSRGVALGLVLAAGGSALFVAPQLATELGLVILGLDEAGLARSDTTIVPGAIIAWAGLCLAAVSGFSGLGHRLQKRSFGIAHVGVGALVVTSIAAIAGSAVLWPAAYSHAHQENTGQVASGQVVTGQAGSSPAWLLPSVVEPLAAQISIAPRQVRPLSAIGTQVQSDPTQGRILALNLTANGVSAQLWRDVGLQLLHTPAVPNQAIAEGTDQADQHLAGVVANLTAGGGVNTARELSDHAVELVVVPPANSQLLPGVEHRRAELIAALDATSGLDFVTNHPSGRIYRVADPAVIARAVATDGTTRIGLDWQHSLTGEVARGVIDFPQGGTLVLAERRSTGWKAELAGQGLRALSADWRQTFEIPAGAQGELRVYYDSPLQHIWLVASGLVGALYLLLSVPISRRTNELEA